jgi:hypothetical protein
MQDTMQDTVQDTVQDGRRVNTNARPRTRRWLGFAGHYLEMLAAMAVGMMALAPAWEALWPGHADRPDTAALAMAANMTVAMAAWMAIRRHTRQAIVLMSAAMVVPFAVLAVPYWVGIMPGSWLMPLGHVLMLPLMALALLHPSAHR